MTDDSSDGTGTGSAKAELNHTLQTLQASVDALPRATESYAVEKVAARVEPMSARPDDPHTDLQELEELKTPEGQQRINAAINRVRDTAGLAVTEKQPALQTDPSIALPEARVLEVEELLRTSTDDAVRTALKGEDKTQLKWRSKQKADGSGDELVVISTQNDHLIPALEKLGSALYALEEQNGQKVKKKFNMGKPSGKPDQFVLRRSGEAVIMAASGGTTSLNELEAALEKEGIAKELPMQGQANDWGMKIKVKKQQPPPLPGM